MSVEDDYVVYTLEKFEEQFPYKIGDKVKTIYDEISIVKQLVWSNKDNAVKYELEVDEGIFYFANELQPYKEETITIDDFKANTKEWLLDNLQSMSKDNALQTISNLYDEIHKPKYPKTYEECCKILKIPTDGGIALVGKWCMEDDYIPQHLEILREFSKLLICRDAYWKIAGEEMGLDKSWNPDFSDDSTKYNIFSYENEIILNDNNWNNRVLVFPTKEIQNAFYENFKDLIEQCKELL